MSVATRRRAFRPGERHEVARRPGGARRRLLAFLVVRVTALMLTVLVLGHFALTHIITDVAEADADFVGRRWSSALWVTWDWLMLASALVHGAAGVWIAIEDYSADPARRRRRQTILVGVSVVLLVLGTFALVAAVI
jgi:succinate dehydrogenase / fumarate reductase membrane anchor subunit